MAHTAGTLSLFWGTLQTFLWRFISRHSLEDLREQNRAVTLLTVAGVRSDQIPALSPMFPCSLRHHISSQRQQSKHTWALAGSGSGTLDFARGRPWRNALAGWRLAASAAGAQEPGRSGAQRRGKRAETTRGPRLCTQGLCVCARPCVSVECINSREAFPAREGLSSAGSARGPRSVGCPSVPKTQTPGTDKKKYHKNLHAAV